MKRLMLLVTFVATLLSASADPQVVWLEETHNFGAFDEDDGPVSCQFRFVNVGDQPVYVKSVRTSCGCTTSTPPRYAIEPGDTASVSATYNPAGRPGRFEKNIYVDMNTSPSRSTLHICGTVIGAQNTLRGRYPVEAGSVRLRNKVVSFGEVKKGKVGNNFFEVYNATRDTLVPAWEQLPPYVRSVSKSMAVAPGELMSYALIFDASKIDVPYGINTLKVFFRAKPDEDPIEVDLIANVIEDFSRLTPQQRANAPEIYVGDHTIDFGSFSTTGSAVRRFDVSNVGHDNLLVRRVYSADPGITATIDKEKIKKNKSATVTVTVDPSQITSEVLNGRVTMITNDPNHPVVVLRVVGFPQ